MLPLVDHLPSGQPALRLGQSVPTSAANIAYVAAPEMTPEDGAQIFDRSAMLPAVAKLTEPFEQSMIPDANGVLIDTLTGSPLVPARDLWITHKMRTIVPPYEHQPFYYWGEIRGYHWEENPPIQDGEYVGEHLQLLENGTPTTLPHIIELTPVSANVYTAKIYTPESNSAQRRLQVRYARCDADGLNRIYQHTEMFNPHPCYAQVSSLWGKLPGDPVYAVTPVEETTDYQVHVPDRPDPLENRDPVAFNWRAKCVVGGVTQVSPWVYDEVYHRASLHAVEINTGDIVYDDRGSEKGAYKKLMENVRDYFSPLFPSLEGAEFSVELDDPGADVEFDLIPADGNAGIWAKALRETGPKDTSGNWISVIAQPVDLTVTIDAYADEYVTPGYDENLLADATKIQSVSFSVPPAIYESWEADPLAVVDQRLPGKDHGLVNRTHSFWGISTVRTVEESPDAEPAPNLNEVKVTGTLILNQEQTVDDFEIVMISGSIRQCVIYNNAGTSTSLTVPSPTLGTDGFYTYVFRGASAYTIKRIVFDVEPLAKKNRDYVPFVNQTLRIWDTYRLYFQICEIRLWKRTLPVSWEGKRVWVPVSPALGSPAVLSLKSLIDAYGLTTLGQPEDTRYLIRLGRWVVDGGVDQNTEINCGSLDIGWDTYASNTERHYTFTPDGQGYFLTREQAYQEETKLLISTPVYHAAVAPLFFVRSREGSALRVMGIPGAARDPWWPLIRNGELRIREQGEERLYRINEYASQPFYDLARRLRRVVGERAEITGRNEITVTHKPLRTDSGAPLAVYPIGHPNEPLTIVDWFEEAGIIYVDENLYFGDEIMVDYFYESDDYLYKGYYDHERESVIRLDLNPLPGHEYVDPETGESHPSLDLLSKAIYLYVLSVKAGDYVLGALPTLRHLIADIRTPEDQIVFPEHALCLAKIVVRAPYAPRNVKIIDSRRRGGGLIEEWDAATFKAKVAETEHFWDIGEWDGEPYPENGALIVTVSRDATVTHDELIRLIERHVALGTVAILKRN
jgi:hypothetical protein